MSQPIVPESFQEELHGFDVLTEESKGWLAEFTRRRSDDGLPFAGHTGKRAAKSGPLGEIQVGQKVVVVLAHAFDRMAFAGALTMLARTPSDVMTTGGSSRPFE